MNDWIEYYDKVNKDGSLSEDFPHEKYVTPSLFVRKLIALSTCFEDLLSSDVQKSMNMFEKRRELLKLAIKHCSGAYNPYVPQVFRKKDDMKERLNQFLLKWVGYSLLIECSPSKFQYDFSVQLDRPEHFPPNLQLELFSDQLYKCPANQEMYLVLVRSENNVFKDANGVIWAATTSNYRFGNSRIFQRTRDGKTLGKEELPQQLLNLARHIWAGCLDYRQIGDSIYQEVPVPVSSNKSRFLGLVKVETAAGQNAVENFFKFLNEVKHGVASYSNEECEVRVSLNILARNYSVDIKHKRCVAPTPHIWYWTRINELSSAILGKPAFIFRSVGALANLPVENFIGFNSFRFETLLNNKANIAEAKSKCVMFLLPSSYKFRWPIQGIFVLHSQKRTVEETPLISEKISALDKPHKVAESAYMSSTKNFKKHYKSPRNMKPLITADEVTTNEESIVLNEIISEMICKIDHPPESITVRAFSQTVAKEFNTTALSNALIGHAVPSLAKKLPKLLSPKAVESHLSKVAGGLETIGQKRKRTEQKHKKINEKYPLTLEMIMDESLTFVEAGKYFSKLKDKWSKRTCSLNRGRLGSDKLLKGEFAGF
jgi:hypothetical protein